MTTPDQRELLIVGTGRVGLALGAELARTGWTLTYAGRAAAPPEHPLFAAGGAVYLDSLAEASRSASQVLLAVPDAAIASVGADLAGHGLAQSTVIHASGVLPSTVLGPLSRRGCAVGSLHPLVSVADPIRDQARLRGAWYGIEGDPPALALARKIVDSVGGRPLPLDPARKPTYHAAAVFASNYIVALLAVAERLMGEAGVGPETARAAITSLAAGAVDNTARSGPSEALTGPIARGDAPTVALHLKQLSTEDRRLYSVLAQQTLALARTRGLEPAAAARLIDLLGGAAP